MTALKRAIDARDHHALPAEGGLAHRRVIGVEALARWTDEVVGPVLPATFVPLAERTGLAEPLTELALETAAADCRRWQNDGHYTPVAVNVPARVLLDPAFLDLVESKRTFGLEEGSLEIEITESTLMGDHDQARRALTRLREIGVRTRSTTSARLLVALLPARAARARAEDRPLVHHPSARRGRPRGDRALDHRAGAEPAARDGGEGRGRARLRPARRARLRLRAGLRAGAADARRRHAQLAARA